MNDDRCIVLVSLLLAALLGSPFMVMWAQRKPKPKPPRNPPRPRGK